MLELVRGLGGGEERDAAGIGRSLMRWALDEGGLPEGASGRVGAEALALDDEADERR